MIRPSKVTGSSSSKRIRAHLDRTINKTELRHQLAKTAQVRAAITLASFIAWLPCLPCLIPEWFWHSAWMLTPILGVPFLVSWLVTIKYCRKAVLCPFCQGSLWSCGSRDFKPRKMRVKADHCPHCQAEVC